MEKYTFAWNSVIGRQNTHVDGNKYRVLSSCHSDPLTTLGELTWVDLFSGDPLGVTYLVSWYTRSLSFKFYKDPN